LKNKSKHYCEEVNYQLQAKLREYAKHKGPIIASITKKNEEEKMIAFDESNPYVGFHSEVWKNLKLVEKALTVIWFSYFYAKENNLASDYIEFNNEIEHVVMPIFKEEHNSIKVLINPALLKDLTNPYDIGEVFHQFIQGLMTAQIAKAVVNAVNGNYDNSFSKLTLVNFDDYLTPGRDLKKFAKIRKVPVKALELIIYAYQQPLDIELRKSLELAKELIEKSEKEISVKDIHFPLYYDSVNLKQYQSDNEFHKLITEEEKEAILNSLYKEHINEIDDLQK